MAQKQLTAGIRPSETYSMRLCRLLASRGFFVGIIVLFVAQAAWIALTARYPMAFDEQFHLGIIQLYAHQHAPFFSQQPAGSGAFGAVARDPSYLYQYLMSFPYRLMTTFVHSMTTQIIVLRFINIALLASSFVVAKKLLDQIAYKPLMRNSVLLAIACLPVVPLLGAQINYDNLLIPLSLLAVFGSLRLIDGIKAGNLNVLLLVWLSALCLLTSLVKYAFLPIFLALLGLVITALIKQRHHVHIVRQIKQVSKPLLIIGLLVVIGSFGLTLERYGINTIRYKTPIPECDQVLSVSECQAYSPWARNYEFLQAQPHVSVKQVFPYTVTWVRNSIRELIFTITSRYRPDGSGAIDYYGVEPLPVPRAIAWGVFYVGGLSLLFAFRRLWRTSYELRAVIIVCGTYLFVLFMQNFMDFKHLGQPVAIHGRYLLPVLPMVLMLWVMAITVNIERLRKLYGRYHPLSKLTIKRVQPWIISTVMIVFFIQGGGVIAFMSLNREDWLWPQSQLAQHVNYTARHILNPIVIGN